MSEKISEPPEFVLLATFALIISTDAGPKMATVQAGQDADGDVYITSVLVKDAPTGLRGGDLERALREGKAQLAALQQEMDEAERATAFQDDTETFHLYAA